MGPSEFIAFFSLIVSVIALIYTFVSNTKRFELADQYRKDLLSWYQDTIRILLKIRGQVAAGRFDWEKSDLLFLLSAQIEIGRFYLPNYPSEKGADQPIAYRGNRHPALNCLVAVYMELKHPKKKDQNEYIKNKQLCFTSVIFTIINPREWNKQRTKKFSKYVSIDHLRTDLEKSYGNR